MLYTLLQISILYRSDQNKSKNKCTGHGWREFHGHQDGRRILLVVDWGRGHLRKVGMKVLGSFLTRYFSKMLQLLSGNF